MKSITQFINENISKSNSTLNFEDVIAAIELIGDRESWYLDADGGSKGSFEYAVKRNKSIYDVLEFHMAWEDLAKELDCEEKEIGDFVYDNEDELLKKMGFRFRKRK